MSSIANDGAPRPLIARPTLPLSGLLAMALLGFIAILTETLPAGLLPQISASLSVRESLTGQLVTSYALGSVAAAIPGAVLTRRWRRRSVLLVAVVGFLVFNFVTAISSVFAVSLAARFLAGAAAGMTWSLVPVYARMMAPPALQGRAMAIALVGTPLALSLGVPIGTWAGGLVGWRLPFAAMSLGALGLVAWVFAAVPDFPGQTGRGGASARQVFLLPGVRPILCVVLTWMLGHNILYTYITPYLRFAAPKQSAALTLLAFGVGALASIWLVGAMIDRRLRVLVLGSTGAFVLAALTFALGPTSAAAILLTAFLWGLTFGGAATLTQTASADATGPDAGIAQSMIVTVWNGAIAGGGIVGGLLLDTFGPAAFAPAVAVLAFAALVIAARAARHGFPSGLRAGL